MNNFSSKIYDSWKLKQLQKYHHLFPILKKHLRNNSSVLDLGIGRAWFEEFLIKKGFTFSKITGVDAEKDSIEPRKEFIEYHLTSHFNSEEKFDFIVCFDSYHLLQNKNLLSFAKQNSLILISLPLRWEKQLNDFKELNIIEEGIIGEEEKDHFILIKV